MKTRKLSVAMVLMLGIWYSALAYAPLGGGEEKGGKGKDPQGKLEAVSTMATPGSLGDINDADFNAQKGVSEAESPNSSVDNTTSRSKTSTSIGKTIAMNKQRHMSEVDKVNARKNLKGALKDIRKDARKKDGPAETSADDMLILCVILCFFIPPLAVFLWENSIGINFWISLVLTLLFFVPGMIFSLIVVLTT